MVARRLLTPFLNSTDPWLKAYAAKTLYRIDARESLGVIEKLLKNPSPKVQLPGVWVLGELATLPTLDLLLPLAFSPHAEIQQAVIRCLIELENKNRIPVQLRGKVSGLFKKLRSKEQWIM